MPPGAQPLPQAVSNVPMPIGLNPNPNIGYPAPLPPTAKSRRMRPTKSITARYVQLCIDIISSLLLYLETSARLTGASRTRAHQKTSTSFGMVYLRTKKR